MGGVRRWAVGSAIVLLAVAALAGWGVLNARAEPVVRTVAIDLTDWPKGAAPIKVALISDIHIGNIVMDPKQLGRIADQVDAIRPDLIVLAGDFVVGQDASGIEARAKLLTAPLGRLRAPLGVLAVLGNHDYWTDSGRVAAALSAAKITVLDNQATQRGPIVVAGVSDSVSRHDRIDPSLAAARRLSGPIVVLTHSPDVALRLPPDARLLLAGHTHCGQVVLPWIGPLPGWSPHEEVRRVSVPRYRCGVVHDPGRTVIVTAGVGSGTAPIRFGAPPDIWLVTLGPALR